jgi:protein-tyrosine phosphatase
MYRITQCLSVGPFPTVERTSQLLAAGVTHVLNVSEGPSEVSSADGFTEVAWVPMSDGKLLSRATTLEALDTLHRLVSAPGAHVYVHCVAGRLRSPTILWLYLIALAVPPEDAREWIESRSLVADAGHFRMVDDSHVLLAQMHGLANYFPHPRPDLILPAPLEAEEEE